jgi:hypothetical protein
MGVLAPRSAHARPSAWPPSTLPRGNFSGAHVCRVAFKRLPQPLRSHIRSFGILGQLLKFSTKKSGKKTKNAPRGLISSSFCENIPPLKLHNSNWLPSNTFKIKLKITPGGGGDKFYFFPRFFFFFFSRSPCPSVVLNSGGKNKNPTRGNIPKLMATFVYVSSQGQRMHSARTKINFFLQFWCHHLKLWLYLGFVPFRMLIKRSLGGNS